MLRIAGPFLSTPVVSRETVAPPSERYLLVSSRGFGLRAQRTREVGTVFCQHLESVPYGPLIALRVARGRQE